MDKPTSRLTETDWNEEWKALQATRRAADDPSFWDARAKHFKPRETHPYARDFMALAAVRPGERVLDMGCGGGSLAIPFAQAGSPVLACDFSPRMLDVLREGIAHFCLHDLVEPKELAWDEDWEAAGVAPKSVDVAIASRSIATCDLAAALMKLDRTARRRCCITLVANASPRVDRHIMDAIGAWSLRAATTYMPSTFWWGLALALRCATSSHLGVTRSIHSTQVSPTSPACSKAAMRTVCRSCAPILPSTWWKIPTRASPAKKASRRTAICWTMNAWCVGRSSRGSR